jgi:hypothetical protein
MPQLSEQKSIPERPKSHLEEPYDFSYLEPKPKIKLGPRPVVTPERPRKSNTMGTSLLPTGYHAKKQEQQRPKSTGPVNYVQSQMLAGLTTFPTPPPIPDVPEYNPRPISRGSVKSMPSQKSTTMTPEKLRLMKAVELRRKQMRKSNPQIRTPLHNLSAWYPNLKSWILVLTWNTTAEWKKKDLLPWPRPTVVREVEKQFRESRQVCCQVLLLLQTPHRSSLIP